MNNMVVLHVLSIEASSNSKWGLKLIPLEIVEIVLHGRQNHHTVATVDVNGRGAQGAKAPVALLLTNVYWNKRDNQLKVSHR